MFRVEYDRSNKECIRRTGNRPPHAVARGGGQFFYRGQDPAPPLLAPALVWLSLSAVVKVVMCSKGGGSASEVETHKNIDSVLHTKTTFQAQSIFSVSIQK